MVAQCGYLNVVLMDHVHHEVLFCDSPRPRACEDEPQGLGLSDPSERITSSCLNQSIDSPWYGAIYSPPPQVVIPCVSRNDHSSGHTGWCDRDGNNDSRIHRMCAGVALSRSLMPCASVSDQYIEGMTRSSTKQSTIRALRADEQDLLARATVGNVNWAGPRLTPDQVAAMPSLAHYYTPWPSDGDFGLVAEDDDGTPIAVAWLRHFDASDPGYGFVDESIPELCVWVTREHRGGGIGTRLLTSLITQTRSQHLSAISLSVETGNPARSLYERLGFVPAGDIYDAETLVLYL